MQLSLRVILFLSCVILFSCDIDKKVQTYSNVPNFQIECNAEKWEDGKFIDLSGKYGFSNAKARTTEEKRSGEYSLKLTKEIPYGMTIMLDDVKPEDYFRVTVWQKGKGHICASDDIPNSFYKADNKPVDTDSLGWQKLYLEFYLPHNYKSSKLKILLCNFSSEPVFFDDLTIVKEENKVFPSYDSVGVMNIFISAKNFQKLNLKRENAIEKGLLITADDDWVKAIIFYRNKVLNTKIRLKGDRLDHLQGKKWSFRIKIKGENSWKGMKTFSIQTPAARNYLHEWFFHKALEEEDLLCTRYGFVPVVVNGQSLGLYAWEEHFEKHLIESRNRREGPILKLSDESYWLTDKFRRQKDIDYSVPNYDASVILPFDKKNYTEDSLLKAEYKYGRDLYYQYKYAKGITSDIFDVEAIAKYYAIIDATNAYHTLHFFNQRFYYNPVLGKLEPIFFDSFADVGIFDYGGTDLVIGNAENKWLSIHLKLFADPKFKNLYFKYLEKYSNRKFWEELYFQNKYEIETLEKSIQLEFKNYKFDMNEFYVVAEKAYTALKAMIELDEKKDLFSKYEDRSISINRKYRGKADFEILPHLVNVYTQSSHIFRVENYSTDTIKVTGFSDIPDLESEKLNNEVIVPPANSGDEFVKDLHCSKSGHNYLFIEIRNKRISIPVIAWGAPNAKPIHQDILHSFAINELTTNKLAKINRDTILFSGNITISNHLVIPENWNIIFEKGTTIDLINGATFISYSPVFVKGTENIPVIFKSSDNTGKGINIFQAKKRSILENATFTGLAKLDFGGWATTSSVCFYESDVDFRNVRFEKNYNCDDALNVIRSDYQLQNCIFEETFADAFDSDFCTGLIDSTQFISLGNDAIDFSGSVVTVINSSVQDAGDKSISCGEQSKITISNCHFDGGNIGVASKDKSEVNIEDSMIKNVTYGLVAFCKKPEYGPAKINSKNLLLKKCLFIHLIEKGSNLNFNNRKIFGQEKNLAKRFY